jgi:methyl-accepting chemotaxis protein
VDVTSETAITAQQGQDEAQVSSSVLDTMVESVKNTGVQMEKLQKNAQDIGAIVDVIRGIAEQTNLLALNAAIEAARAGENGRGFAVVADEVRSLAQRTQQSTIEIQDMIAQLQSNTEKASIHIQDGQVKAEDSASHMLTLSQSLLSMVHSVSRIKELNTSIAAAAREQGSVTDEISEKITAVSDGIGQSSHYAENTAETGRMLSELSGELRQRMRQFKT